jgi:signal peptidase I
MPIPDPQTPTTESKRKPKAHPWRDNIEAITVSIVIIVLFKYFVLEAYKIPTPSMQPTLMGWENPEGGGIFDRVLVDKLSFHYRDPERFEIAVFKYPLDRSKNFIKRIWGLPGEELEVRDGDVWVRETEAEEWHIPRRPEPMLEGVLKRLDSDGEWRKLAGDWDVEGDHIKANGPGSVRFPRSNSSVMDGYADGYPEGIREIIAKNPARTPNGTNHVGDLRFDSELEARANCSIVQVTLHEGTRSYSLRIPGPAAEPDAKPELLIRESSPKVGSSANRIDDSDLQASEPFALKAGDSVHLRAENLDDRVSLWLDDEEIFSVEIDAIRQVVLNRTGVSLETEGGGADFGEVELHRDIYYTSNVRRAKWKLPEDGYVVLGDNTQNSSDSRDWSLTRWQLTGGEEQGHVIQGNERDKENPRFGKDPDRGTLVFLHDEQGERHVFPQTQARRLAPELMSYVPRSLIRGRAVLVVWPISPSLGVYRLKWVR